jgi:hypothetical protein
VWVFHKSLAWDAEAARYVVRECNSTNKLGLGIFIADKLTLAHDFM